MPANRKLIGITKVAMGWKIGMLKDVADKLNVKIGDKVVFVEENGRVFLEKV